jgi:ketosteroid isomerase-like protein
MKPSPTSIAASAVALCVLLAGGPLSAQPASQAADHDALRKLKTDVVNAINAKDFQSIDKLLHKPFMSTLISQDSFTDANKLKAWFDDLFTRSVARISKITMEAEADEPAQIYTGTFAVARGGTKETYNLADGRTFVIPGRWTATTVKDNNGEWKLLAVHTGVNFIDNPIMTAVEKTTTYFGAGGLAIGAVIGFLLGFFIRRKRAAA